MLKFTKIVLLLIMLLPFTCYASCQVTFSRFTKGLPTVIPVGATVESADGKSTFEVIADTANKAFDASANGYRLSAMDLSITVPVALNAQASQGPANAQQNAGTINVITSQISAIDTAKNESNCN